MPFHQTIKIVVVHRRLSKPAVVLVNQMMQLAGQHAGDLHLDPGNALSHEADPVLPVQAEQCPFPQELDHLGVLAAVEQGNRGLLHKIAANGLDPLVDFDHQLSFDRHVKTKTVQAVERFRAWDQSQVDGLIQIGFIYVLEVPWLLFLW